MANKYIAEVWRKIKNKKTGTVKKVRVKPHLRKPKKTKS